jgi:hypothetical protein
MRFQRHSVDLPPPAFRLSPMTLRASFLAVTPLFLIACTGSNLDAPANHPGHPLARAGRLDAPQALTCAYALDGASTTPAGNQSGAPDHSAHNHNAPSASAAGGTSHGAVQPASDPAYICPMHPEVISKAPGNCPKCGMKLVPKKAAKP